MTYTPVIKNYLFSEPHTFNGRYFPAKAKYSSRYGMAPKAIFIHIQEGSNWGSWLWWYDNVQASSTILLSKTGEIWQVVPEHLAPWTNGDVMSPTSRGRALINRWGGNPNTYSLTIELEGFTGNTVPDAQKKALVWQVREWMRKYNLTVDDVYRHADVNQVTRPRCPGDAIFNWLIAELKKGDETPVSHATPVAPVTPKPSTTTFFDGSKDVTLANGTTLRAKKQRVKLTGAAHVRQYAGTDSKILYTLPAGSTVELIGEVDGESVNGNKVWGILPHMNGRIWSGNYK